MNRIGSRTSKNTLGSHQPRLPSSKNRDENNGNDPFSKLPPELNTEILLKLRAKDISKLIFVSKHLSSIIHSRDFIECFLSPSLNRPPYLFAFRRRSDYKLFFQSSSHEDPLSDHHRVSITQYKDQKYKISPPVNGLICCQNYGRFMICNPSTGQFLTLPRLQTWCTNIPFFFGYDPVSKLYKVLCMLSVVNHQVFTLGAETAWRTIKCKLIHRSYNHSEGICKNGVVYYLAYINGKVSMISFDLASEDFNVITLPQGGRSLSHVHCDLVDYNGKIAFCDRPPFVSPRLWVLEDANKQEWLQVNVLFPSLVALLRTEYFKFKFMGAISTGELIFVPGRPVYSFYIICYDMEKNKERRVVFKELSEGLREGVYDHVEVFLNHIETPLFPSNKSIK